MAVVVEFFGYFVQFYTYIMLFYIILGYFPEARGSKLYEILEKICEPILRPFEFATIGGISLAPILAILTLQLIHQLLLVLMTL